jgi:hypothetical protein
MDLDWSAFLSSALIGSPPRDLRRRRGKNRMSHRSLGTPMTRAQPRHQHHDGGQLSSNVLLVRQAGTLGGDTLEEMRRLSRENLLRQEMPDD